MTSFLSLKLLILLPIIASIMFFMPILKNNFIYIRRFTILFSIIYFFYSVLFYIFYNVNNNDCVLCTSIPIIKNWGINFSLGVDSLSIIMILLTTFIFLLVSLSAKLYIKNNHKYFYALILLLESILIGIFSTTDMFLFFGLWELELIPMYILISLYGNHKAKEAALKFVIYTFAGSLFILLAILLIYHNNFILTGILTGNFTEIQINNLNLISQILISVLLLLGFGVKIPIIPLHRWLIDTHSNSCTPVSVILAAILLKLGVYGVLRFNLGFLPLGFSVLAPILACLALINIIYGAALAYNQNNIKKIIAYSSISQMGIIILGISSMTYVGYIGAIYHIVSHAFVAAGLFIVAGIIKQKFNTNELNVLNGIQKVTPKSFGFFIVSAFAGIGTPFLSGFVGEFLSIYGSILSPIPFLKIFALLATIILILSALYILKIIHKGFYGILPCKYLKVQDVAVHEFIILTTISIMIFILGCFPNLLIEFFTGV